MAHLLKSIALAGYAALTLGTLACGGAQPTPQTPGETDQPRYGGTFNVSSDDPNDLDMSSGGSTTTNARLIKPAYSTVLRLKTGPGMGNSEVVIEPYLAESWEVSPDAKTYTFYLRKGVKFANLPPVNGRELTSADVKWSYEYVSRTGALKDAKLPNSQFAFLFEGLEGVQTPDPYTVVVQFKDSFATFLSYAATSDNVIMPHEIYDQDGHFKERIAGSGPFQPDFQASQKGSSWVIKKNPTHFETGKPYLDSVRFIVVRDEATRNAAFTAKQLDYLVGGRDASVWDEIKKNVPNAVVYEFTNTPAILALNLQRKPLDNRKIREAVSLALNRDELVKVAVGGRGEWALAFSNMRADLFTQEEIKAFIKHDPDRAKRLVAEAGYPNGLQIEIIFSGEGGESLKVAQLYQAQLKKGGIDLVLKPLPGTELTVRRRAKDLDMLVLSEAQRADLDGALNLAVRTGGSFNYNNIADAKVDFLLSAQRKETDPAKRDQVLRELVRYLNESFLAISTFRTGQAFFWHPYVRDFYHHADLRDIGVLEKVWLAK